MFRQGMPWLVRRIERPSKWRLATVESADISEVFASLPEDISGYQVATDIQEAEVAAALWLTKGASLKDLMHLLRISLRDVAAAGLQVKETSGVTDVRHIDVMHRDLVGDLPMFTGLARQIVARSRAGEDTVRTVAGQGLSQRIADFLESGHIGERSVQKGKKALEKADQTWPRQ